MPGLWHHCTFLAMVYMWYRFFADSPNLGLWQALIFRCAVVSYGSFSLYLANGQPHCAVFPYLFALYVFFSVSVYWPYFLFRSQALCEILRVPYSRHCFLLNLWVVIHNFFLLSCTLSYGIIFCRTRHFNFNYFLWH